MSSRRSAIAIAITAASLAGAPPALAADYARAPITQYQNDRADEIAMARSAAPPSISKDATVLVLGAGGYETGLTGTNGFTCLVFRSWGAALDDPEFWNPKVRAPICLNAAATRSVLPAYLKRSQWVLAGQDLPAIRTQTRAAVASGAIGAPAVGAMCYMMSKQGYLSDKAPHWHPHLMYFLPKTDPAAWGANLPGSPMIALADPDEPVTVFLAPVPAWSDGTMGPMEM